MIGALIFAAIQLVGVQGRDLRARAYFDAYNVKVGDPLVLTLDFVGEVEFSNLHPPALSRLVNRRDWKLDDASAKTDTGRRTIATGWFSSREIDVSRLITYRVRPMRKGVLTFPALEFEYRAKDGTPRIVRSNAIPVHARAGSDVVVEEMGEDLNAMPQPAALVVEFAGLARLPEDEAFAWRKACTHPSAAAFAPFDFPEARLNEARCELLAGNWAKAMKIYRRLEWSVGQTPEIERGIVAAQALRYDNPQAELPVARQVLRPLLRFAWAGRVGIVLGGLAALAFVLWLVGRGIRAMACLAVAFGLALTAEAQFFSQRIVTTSGGKTRVVVNGVEQEPIKVRAYARVDNRRPVIGETFNLVVAVDAPGSCTLEDLSVTPVDVPPGFSFAARQFERLTDAASATPSNVIRRMSIPVRCLSRFTGEFRLVVAGSAVRAGSPRQNGFFFGTMSFGEPFKVAVAPVRLDVQAPAGAPADFSGIVARTVGIRESCDSRTVGTNDVVVITYRLSTDGFVPDGFQPKDVAFEWGRDQEGRQFEYRRFFVADGARTTPVLTIPYYDPASRTFRRATGGGTPLTYRKGED